MSHIFFLSSSSSPSLLFSWVSICLSASFAGMGLQEGDVAVSAFFLQDTVSHSNARFSGCVGENTSYYDKT